MRHKYVGIYRDGAGNIVSGGTVSVYTSGTTTPASIYTRDTSTTVVNSVTSDANGVFEFYYLEGNHYGDHTRKIVLSKAGFTTTTYDYVGPSDFYVGGLTNATILEQLTAIGTSTEATLLLRPGAWTISANVDWSAYTNITLKFTPGAYLSHGAYTMSLPYFTDDMNEKFVGTGKITCATKQPFVRPEWWGAIADNLAGSAAANTLALTAAWKTTKPIQLSEGNYRYIGPLNYTTDKFVLKGIGKYRTMLINIGTGGEEALTFSSEMVQISDLSIIGNASSGGGIYFNDSTTGGYTGLQIELNQSQLLSHGEDAIAFIGGEDRYVSHVNIIGCDIRGNTRHGIYADENQTINTITVSGTTVSGINASYVANGSEGIKIARFQTLTVVGSSFQSFVYGIRAGEHSGYGFSSTNNYFEAFTEAGISLGGTNFVSGFDISGGYFHCNAITNTTTGAGIRIVKGFGTISSPSFSYITADKKSIVTVAGGISIDGAYEADITGVSTLATGTRVDYVGALQQVFASGLHIATWNAELNRSVNLYAEASTTYYFAFPVKQFDHINKLDFYFLTDNADATVTWTLYRHINTGGSASIGSGVRTGQGAASTSIDVRVPSGHSYTLKTVIASDGVGGSYAYLYIPNVVGSFQ